jgi:hypothetical protein
MQTFTDFILQVTYPPNPIRNLDNSLTADQQAGRDFFFNHAPTGQELPSDTFHNCETCHVLNPTGNAEFGVPRPGFFGTDGRYSFESETQYFKVPHLRNLYQKVGMFGMAPTFGLPIDSSAAALLSFLPPPLNDTSFQGDQVRGFGFIHDGSVDTLFRFFGSNVFAQRGPTSRFPNPYGIPTDASGVLLRRQIESFALAFDSNLAPIVGQQVTLTLASGADVASRIDLLEARAAAGECDLVVHGQVHNQDIGYLFDPASATYVPNYAAGPRLTDAQLRALVSAGELTFTAAPPASGERIGLDRDGDGILDGDERGNGTDPAERGNH